MVKLTPDLINQSMQYMNPCRDRELDLRGYKIPQIENMGATLDQFDTIDFSDNDIRKLDGFPRLPRLKCLLLNNNRIVRISENLHESLPNLQSVILTGNNIQELGDLEPLTKLPNLETLSLLTNPVSTKQHYREYCAFRFPSLRLLDFRKIRQKEREAANQLFKSKKGKEMHKEIMRKAKQAMPGVVGTTTPEKQAVQNATPADIQKIREAIKRATNLHEVDRLNRMLQSGQITGDIMNGNEAAIHLSNSNHA
ncbi:probable U2 small nuclear ribonucleoprotein A' isoform X1 [Anopheles ziemanni]|uniref:probable U2 small nuclear ribonucleoprotein A' isoform X1 n=1 Tax=Anopheles coustani TaxID=139045 RepID=UPI00265A313F|nr:probable U2 small nuclear ribonucleoprotein A' isoform X1 [Anopheles coustani]XP_058178208.1 probable U2 small nuclear ribonucleoprotein A' isoform X1 [Anopheles ziemanni]